jgi:hypothetical protein
LRKRIAKPGWMSKSVGRTAPVPQRRLQGSVRRARLQPCRPEPQLVRALLNAAKVMSSSQVELPNAGRSRTAREIAPQGLKPSSHWPFSARLKSCPDTKHFLKLARNRPTRTLVLQSSIAPEVRVSMLDGVRLPAGELILKDHTTAELALDRSADDRSSLPIAVEAAGRAALPALDFGELGQASQGGGTDGRALSCLKS